MRKAIAATTVAIVLSLAACAEEEGVPQPRSGNDATEILSQERYAAFSEATKTKLAEADEARNPELLTYRIAPGPLKEQRTAHYKLRDAVGDSYTLDPIVIDPAAVPVSNGSAFPRTFMTFTGPRDGENLSTLTVWTQKTPRQNYQLWAETEIFPGVSVPAIVSQMDDVPGYPDVDPSEFAADPSAVLEAYVAYNESQEQGDIVFEADDPLYTEIADQQETLSNSIGDLGSAETTFAASDHEFHAVSTTDGGLILVGDMRYTIKLTRTNDDATLRISGEIGAMFDGEDDDDNIVEVDDPVHAVYSTTVAFYIPPAGGAEAVKVIASTAPTLLSVAKVEPEEEAEGEGDSNADEENADAEGSADDNADADSADEEATAQDEE